MSSITAWLLKRFYSIHLNKHGPVPDKTSKMIRINSVPKENEKEPAKSVSVICHRHSAEYYTGT